MSDFGSKKTKDKTITSQRLRLGVEDDQDFEIQ